MVPGKEVTLMTQAAVLKVNKSTGANQPQLTVSSDAGSVEKVGVRASWSNGAALPGT